MNTGRAGHACAWCKFKQLTNDMNKNEPLNRPFSLVVVGGHTEGNGKLQNIRNLMAIKVNVCVGMGLNSMYIVHVINDSSSPRVC